MNRVYDTDAPSRETAVNGLGVLQVGIHPRRWIPEPGAKVAGGVLRVPPVLRDQPRRRQRRHLHAESNQRMTMCNEVVGIGHPVALNIRPIGMFWIRPPVVSLGKVVVLAAGAALSRIRGDSDGTLAKIPGCGAQYPPSVNLDDIDTAACRRSNIAPP